MYGILAQIEPDTEQALGYLDKARKAAEAAKTSTAPWDLAELAMRIARGDVAEADRLLQHIRDQHIREPGVAQALFQILTEAGIIGPDGRPTAAAAAAAQREPAGIVVPGAAAAEAGKNLDPRQRSAHGRQEIGALDARHGLARHAAQLNSTRRTWLARSSWRHAARAGRAEPDGRLRRSCRTAKRSAKAFIESSADRMPRSRHCTSPARARRGRRSTSRSSRAAITARRPPAPRRLIAAGVRRVVVAQRDPFPQVAGQGIAELKRAGIEVEVGLLESEARELNAPYLKLVTTGRPWIIAKWAMTLDGKLATRSGDSRWISGEASRDDRAPACAAASTRSWSAAARPRPTIRC